MLAMLQKADRTATLTLIGTALIKLATGVIGIWGSINIYFFSYLHNHGAEITPRTNSAIMLCSIVPSALLMLLSTRFTRYFGYKQVIRTCGLIFSLSPFLINIWLNVFTMGLFFLFIPITCFAISSIPILNCLWSQFPNDLNKVSGAAVLFFSSGMIVWNLVFTNIVNPHNMEAEITQHKQAFFGSQITDEIVKASNIIFLCSGFCFLVGSMLISKREDPQTIGPKLVEELHPDSNLPESKSETVIVLPSSTVDKSNKDTLTLKQALKDSKFLILFTISFLTPLYLIYLVLYMKLIFMPLINDDHYLAYCSIILTVAAIIGAPFWGAIGDRFGFKTTLFLLIIIDLACKIFGLFCRRKWNLMLMYFLLGFNDKGILTIIGPGLIEIFGLEMATQLIPYKGISVFLAYFTVPAIQFLLPSFSYRLILLFFIFCSLVAVTLTYYFYSKVEYQPFHEETKQVDDKPVPPINLEANNKDILCKVQI